MFSLSNVTTTFASTQKKFKKFGKKLRKQRDGEVEVEEVTKSNVHQSIKEIRENSSILADLETEGKIKIVGAVYHVEDGRVSYL